MLNRPDSSVVITNVGLCDSGNECHVGVFVPLRSVPALRTKRGKDSAPLQLCHILTLLFTYFVFEATTWIVGWRSAVCRVPHNASARLLVHLQSQIVLYVLIIPDVRHDRHEFYMTSTLLKLIISFDILIFKSVEVIQKACVR